MIAIVKFTCFCLVLLISTALIAAPDLEIESTDLDPNTKVLTDETVLPGTVIHGEACCNIASIKALPYRQGSPLEIFFNMPLGSSIRVWLQDQQKYGKVVCNKEHMGCVPIDWVNNVDRSLYGVALKNQCNGKPTNLLYPVGAYIGFSVLEGSVKVDGIEEPFTCEGTSKNSRRKK